MLLDNELSLPPVGAKQPEASEQSSNDNSWVYSVVDKYRPSRKGQHTLLKCKSWLNRVMILFGLLFANRTSLYKVAIGVLYCTIDLVFMCKNFMWRSKMLISAIGYYD